jgi:hypothetical protein
MLCTHSAIIPKPKQSTTTKANFSHTHTHTHQKEEVKTTTAKKSYIKSKMVPVIIRGIIIITDVTGNAMYLYNFPHNK